MAIRGGCLPTRFATIAGVRQANDYLGRRLIRFLRACALLGVCSPAEFDAARCFNDLRLAAFFFAAAVPFWCVPSHSCTVFRMMRASFHQVRFKEDRV